MTVTTSDLETIISKENIKYNEPMSKHTSFRTGGKADYFITAKTVQDVQNLIKYGKTNNIPIYILGNGTNILVKDEGIKGIVLKIDLQELDIKEKQNNVIVTAGAGIKMMALAQILMRKGISGFEELSGIPGTVGGANTMNAGAFDKEMKDIILETKCLDLDTQNIVTLKNEEQNLVYRGSIFKNKKYIIIETTFCLAIGDSIEIQKRMASYAIKRKDTQPYDFPSAGSTFKRGDDFITANLIDKCGLKGYSIGGAQISEKHAGFIVNNGNATSKDIIDLIEYTKKKVYEEFGKIIEEEVEII